MSKRPEESLSAASEDLPTESEWSFAESLLGYNLRRAYAAQLQRFHAHFSKLDIRPVQFTLLGHLYHNPGTSQARVGKMLDIQRANLVTLLDELEKRGLLMREPARGDKRSRVLNLTAAGIELTERLLEINTQAESDLDELMGRENRLRLIELLRFIRNL